MRLPLRSSSVAAVALLSLGVALGQAPPVPEVPGGTELLTPPPPTVTRIQEAPATTEAAPQPLGYESDVYCFGYVGAPSEAFAGWTIGAENLAEQIDYVTGDRLYLNGGHDRGFKAGDEFWLVTPEDMVVHPATGQDLGRFYKYRGRAVIETVEPRTATARVTDSCTDIPAGSFLKPFEPVPIPLARKTPPAAAGDPPSGKVKGHIVYTRDGIVAVGYDHDVIVDLGLAHGIEAGDFLTVFRYALGREYGIRPVGRYWVNLPPPAGTVVPRTYLGELAVLTVGDRWAIGRITDSYRLIEVGDEVELK
jgi:hypothetical protein